MTMTPGASAGGASGTVRLRFGGYSSNAPLVGKTIAEARVSASAQWGTPGDAKAFKGKEQLEDNYVLQPGDEIEFHKRQGEKG